MQYYIHKAPFFVNSVLNRNFPIMTKAHRLLEIEMVNYVHTVHII